MVKKVRNKKIICVFVVFATLILIAASIYAILLSSLNKREIIYIYKAQIIPEIDGIWEKGEWEDAKFYTYCFKENDVYVNPDGMLSMIVGLKWTEKYLFFTAYITDNVSPLSSVSIGIMMVEEGKPTLYRDSLLNFLAIKPNGYIHWFVVENSEGYIAFYDYIDKPYDDEAISGKMQNDGWIIEAKLRIKRFPSSLISVHTSRINIIYFQHPLAVYYSITNPAKPETFPIAMLEKSVYQGNFCYHERRVDVEGNYIDGYLFRRGLSNNNSYKFMIGISYVKPVYPKLFASNGSYNFIIYIRPFRSNSNWTVLNSSDWEYIDADNNSYITSGDLLLIHNYTKYKNYEISIKVYHYGGDIYGGIP